MNDKDDLIMRAYQSLLAWCRARNFSGYDPFDGLNSRLFNSLPFKNSRTARLVITQGFKRLPVNLRPLAFVPAGKNPKGIALFALAALADVRRARQSEITTESHVLEAPARNLLNELLGLQLTSASGASGWGYNFDWQGRAFFAPQGTPTVVPTAFAVRALTEGYDALGDENYLSIARSACEFIRQDLNVTHETADEICWSYSPLDQPRVFNASLLAAETLATVATRLSDEQSREEFFALALRGAHYVARAQRADGSWAYGADAYQGWADNFHTAYVLTSFRLIQKALPHPDADIARATERGYEFWRASFFCADGAPKYFHNQTYPLDPHATAAAVIALCELKDTMPDALRFAGHLARWAIENMQDAQGFFYYQRTKFYLNRNAYMRWTQGWMAYALARLLEVKSYI